MRWITILNDAISKLRLISFVYLLPIVYFFLFLLFKARGLLWEKRNLRYD